MSSFEADEDLCKRRSIHLQVRKSKPASCCSMRLIL